MLKDGTQTATAGIGFYAGTVSLPGIYLGTDTATGLYRIGLNNDGYSINGTKLLDLSSALVGITGALTVSTTLAVTGHVTVEGVTSTGATGTGNFVFSASPTFTGTITGAIANWSGLQTASAGIALSGTASNLSLGSNYINNSGANTDEGISIASGGATKVTGTSNNYNFRVVGGTADTLNVYNLAAGGGVEVNALDSSLSSYSPLALRGTSITLGYQGNNTVVVSSALLTVTGAVTMSSTLEVGGGAWFGTAALATNATTGHVYIQTSAGAPTGVPAGKTGQVAFQYDTTNNKLYVYNGAWKSTAALT